MPSKVGEIIYKRVINVRDKLDKANAPGMRVFGIKLRNAGRLYTNIALYRKYYITLRTLIYSPRTLRLPGIFGNIGYSVNINL